MKKNTPNEHLLYQKAIQKLRREYFKGSGSSKSIDIISFIRNILNHNFKDIRDRAMGLDQDEEEFEYFCRRHHRFSPTPVKTLMPLALIKEKSGSATCPISCYSEFAGLYLPPRQRRIFSFISGNWANLIPSLESRGKEINLFQYTSDLERLMPLNRKTLHLVTYQNGIKNSPKDFRNMGEAISIKVTEVFGHSPLCIGFYNPTTHTVTLDSTRALLRYAGTIDRYIQNTAIWFETLLTLLRRNPQLHWLHIAHSEGGVIAYLALKMVLMRQHIYNIPVHNLANHLILSAFAPLHPIPETLIPNSFIFYNCKDKTTLRFGVKFKDPRTETVLHPGYDNITFEHSKERYMTPLPPGDHSFLGGTYEKLLVRNLEREIKSIIYSS